MSDEPLPPEVVMQMWGDLIHLAAFQIIHGPVAGYRRFRYLRFGVPESEPLPEGVDFSKVQMPPMIRRHP